MAMHHHICRKNIPCKFSYVTLVTMTIIFLIYSQSFKQLAIEREVLLSCMGLHVLHIARSI